MHALMIPSFYPEKHRPISGIFFYNQAKAILTSVDKFAVSYVEQKSLRKSITSFPTNYYQKVIRSESGVLTYRRKGISLLNQYEFGGKIWIKLTHELVDEYIQDNGVPDVIHAHNVFNAGRVALEIYRDKGIPYVVTEHSSGYLLNTHTSSQLKICTEVYNSAKSIIAVSSALGESISKITDKKIVVIPNTFETEVFKVDRIEKDSNVFYFLCVGNLIRNKGQRYLIESFIDAFKNVESVKLIVIGDGDDKDELMRYVIENSHSNKILFKESVTPSELSKIYNSCHCLVSPSYKETFGVVIIEALACGLPVISTRSGGPEDIINSNNGILVDIGSKQQMSDALLQMYHNHEKYNSKIISREIHMKYNPTIIGQKIVKCYGKTK